MAAIDIKKLMDVTSELDKRSTDALVKAIKDNHLEGFDYLKFMHSVRTLLSMDIDEETAYKSAFTTAKTMGFTKDAFKKGARHYLNVLSSQRESFADALKRQRADKVTGKADKNKAIEQKIEAHKQKIEKLKAEIKIYETKLLELDSNIEKERVKLENVTKNFVESYDHFEAKIKSDLELFEQYL